MKGLKPLACPAILVQGHAPFAWGKSPADAAYHAVVVEEIAAMATETVMINSMAQPISQAMRDRHHFRKHGPNATYGQAG